ncbi:hypothetical protein BC332_27431 [Capsicum chinense]|nr:hypothetical protein BC332_27431 [Capsicum chinense]
MDVEIEQITSQENPQKLQNNKEAITKDNQYTVAGTISGSPNFGNNNSSNLDLTFHKDQKDGDDGMDDCYDVSNYDDVDEYLSESHCKNDSVPDNASPHSSPLQKYGSVEEGEHSSEDVSLNPATSSSEPRKDTTSKDLNFTDENTSASEKCPVCQLEHPNGYPNTCLILAHYLEEQFPELYASREKASTYRATSQIPSAQN